MMKRITALLLCAAMVISMVPAQVFAAESEETLPETAVQTTAPAETTLPETTAPAGETTAAAESTAAESTASETEETAPVAEETAGETEGSVPATEETLWELAAAEAVYADQWAEVDTDALYNEITVQPGQLVADSCEIVESEIYGYVVDYPLKKGHVLSISDENYVFSVRKLVDGNYSTLLKSATTASFTATEDMTVGMLIRKPDKSAVTAEELASIVIYDSQFGMIGVEGSVRRFTVEAETIDGGTATTRAAIFLPAGYSESGDATRLIIMTNGYHAHLTDSVWNANSTDDIAVMKHYMDADYAVLIVDNTAQKTTATADWGNPQLVSSYWKAYEHVQANFNVEERFSLHSRSMGTFAAVRIMRERPELVKCALMCGAVLSLQSRFSTDPAFMAKRYGFDDTTGNTWEADKVVGYDPYTDVDGAEYALPPTFWMLAEADATSAHLATIEKIKNHGNDVTQQIYTDTDHSGVCRLNIEQCRTDSLAFLEKHETSTAEHRFCAWTVTKEVTCAESGELRRNCADCSHYEVMTAPAQGHNFAGGDSCTLCGRALAEEVTQTVTVIPGQFSDSTGAWAASDIYGCVIGYELKQGHTLSISDGNYVFAVRQLIDGNYNTMVKSATVDSFTAGEDMTVSIRVRKPDKSTVTEEELAAVVLYDSVSGTEDSATGSVAATEVASGTCGTDLTWVLDSTGTLTISGTGPMDDWSYTKAPWYEYFADITGLVIQEGVTTIGKYAFTSLANMTSAVIPEGIVSINSSAFSGCTALTGVQLPSTVTTIGDYGFSGCPGLTELTLPEGLTSIGKNGFSNCEGLTEIVIPEGIETIDQNAFSGCSGLTRVTLPGTLKSINKRAFSECKSLTSITLPEGLDYIGQRAFEQCTSLTGITLPESVGEICSYAFSGCTALTEITVPSGLTSIDDSVFYGCTGLTAVTLPDGITAIGQSAFEGCTGLTEFTIPEGVTTIGQNAFRDCTGLTEITIPETVTSLNGFYGCTGLTEITIPDSVTEIGNRAFYGCTGLTEIIIPESVTSIGSDAFRDCTGITEIVIPEGITKVQGFYGCTNLEKVTLPESVTSIDSLAFANCKALQEISLPEGLTSINNSAFEGAGLKEITIPEGVTSIGRFAFSGCSQLTGISLPEGVTSIGEYAFSGCAALTGVTIPASVTSISGSAFKNCTALTHVRFGGSAPTINSSAFNGVTATVFYPAEDATWTETMLANYGGTLTWTPGCGDSHTAVTDPGTAATCTEAGLTEGSHCSVCYELLTAQTVIPALGHSYSGLSCTVCGKEYAISDAWPSLNTDLTHIVAYGQSFSTGSDAPIYADPAVDGVYVLGGITDSSGDALTAIPATGTQHPIISAVNSLAQLLTGAGIDTDIIAGSYGTGGRTIAQLMSAERQAEIKAEEGYTYDINSSGKYTVFQNSVAAIADYAEANSQSVSCPVIVYLQGETDQNTDAELGYPDNPIRAGYGAGGDKEKYKEYMRRLKEDMQQEVMEAYGQTEKPLFLIYQVSGTYVRTQYSSINMAQIEFAQENEDVILVQTPYFAPHYTSSHHLTVNGYRWLGEYIAQSMYTALVEREKPWPMLPQEFTVEDASTLRVTVSGAVNGLTIDTWTVEDATNTDNLYGFYLMINGSRVVPQSATVEGSDIVLALPDNAVPLNKAQSVYVYYGGQGAKGTGNIRDNSTLTGFYAYLDDSSDTGTGNDQGVSHSALDAQGNSLVGSKYPLYNWLASFCYEIEVPEAEQKQAAFCHWEMQETGLVCVSEAQNDLTLLQGSVENGVLTDVQYSMDETVVLYHNKPWVIEWKAAGNGSSYGGGMLLAAADGSGSKAGGLYLPADSRGLVAWNVSSEGRNYGIKLSAEGIDTRQEHTYRIENRIAADGTNTVYLIVDGVEIGDMNTSYSTSDGSLNEDITNWANGADIYLSYMGMPTSFLLKNMKLSYLKIWEDGHTHTYENGACTACGEAAPSLEGKTLSILGDSISTFTGVSNSTAYNSTIGSNAVYYSDGTLGVSRADTWWQQAIDALGMELLVNNSWSGSCIFPTRSGTVGAYASRCVQLHNDTTGEEPDVIAVFMGTNDFSYYQSTLGTADIDYSALITDNGDGTYAYAAPTTTCEAYAVMLHKMQTRYPNAEIFCMTLTARRDPDKEDSYADVGQPTAFNAELTEIIEHFGCTVVDLENCGIDKDAEVFDTYMGDGRVHPNAAGMDKLTEALVSAMLGKKTAVYAVTENLTYATMDNTAHAVLAGGSYAAQVSPETGCSDLTVTVTMGGADITASCYSGGSITIGDVTGDIVITAEAAREPMDFRWEFDGAELASVTEAGNTENTLIKLAGSSAEGVFTDTHYQFTVPVELRHDRPWILEWKGEGAGGFMLATGISTSAGPYFFRRAGNYLNAFGYHDGSSHNNYGVALDTTEIDGSASHVYRLENRVAEDGTNMVWLYVDGAEIGALNNYYVGGTAQGTTGDWLSGKDFRFRYIGTTSHPLTNYAMEYLKVWENGHTHTYESTVTAPTCTEQGYTAHTCACGDSYVDTYVDALGHSFESGACTVCGLRPADEITDLTDQFDSWTVGGPVGYATGAGFDELSSVGTNVNLKYSDYVCVEDFDVLALTVCARKGTTATGGYAFYTDASADSFISEGASGRNGNGANAEGTITHTIVVPEGAKYIRVTYWVDSTSYAADVPFSCQGYQAAGCTHQYTSEVTPPTCTERGYTTHICTACGLGYVDAYVNASGDHSYDDGVCTSCGSSVLGTDWIAPNFADGDYTMVVLPDPQNLVSGWQDDYIAMCQWIADQKDVLKIQAVMHMGDMVNSNNTAEWTACKSGMDIIDVNGIPWMPMMGNHDDSTWFNQYFDYAAYGTGQSWFGGSYEEGKLDHSYWYVTVGQREYMILSLGWAPDWDVLTWAQGIVEANPDKNVILNCHAYMNKDGSLLAQGDTYSVTSFYDGYPEGEDVWAAFKDYENVVLAMGGHIHSSDVVTWVGQNGDGRDVTSLLFDRQDDDIKNHLGMIGLLTFHEDSDTVDINWYSSRYDALYREQNQFSIEVPHICKHTYESTVTAPTCTAQGYTTHTCDCGYSYVDTYVDALGHSYGAWTAAVIPTLTQAGQEVRICSVCDMQETRQIESPDSLDDIAWNGMTYRDIFIENNIVYVDGFNMKTFAPFVQSTGTNPIAEDIFYSGPYCLAAFGSPSQQVASPEVIGAAGEYFLASKVWCTRYETGTLGVCLGTNSVGLTEVSNGFVTASGIVSASASNKAFLGSFHTADLDGYVDDPVAVNLSLFEVLPTEEQLTQLYNNYADLEKARVREEILFTEQEMLDAFVRYMNSKAISIGMTDSSFTDPVGMDNLSTAENLLRLMVYAETYPELKNVWNQTTHTVTVSGENAREQKVTSTVIKPELEDYYHILGGKTGTLSAHDARNLAVILEIPDSDDKLAVVVLYADGQDGSENNRYEVVRQVADAALAKYRDPNADISSGSVGCQSAVACLIPAEGADLENLTILYEKEADIQKVPASITKVLTAICAIELLDALNATFTYTQFDTQIGSFYAEDFVPGDKISYQDALYAMLLPSSNVTARAVARTVGERILENEIHIHTYEKTVTAPTCTEQGYTTYTCDCGDSYVDAYVAAKGHSYGDWSVTTQPTCTEKGAERRDCTACDAYETREAAALGHDLTQHQAQAATCTEIGWNAYETCSRCDHSTYAEIAAKGHSYKSVVTAPTCTEKGYTTHTCSACGDSYVDTYVEATGHSYEGGSCSVCGAAQWDTDGDGVLEILAIGNSFSIDALQYAYQIAQALGIEEIVIGNLYIGGCSLSTHAANAAGDLAKYTYYYNENGTWTSTESYRISTALDSCSWDYVSLQQVSSYSGVESTYNEDLTDLIAYVQARSDARLVWHMTWAYQQDSTHSAFPTYGSDQMTMYNAIVSAVQNKIVSNSAFDRIVPNGTAVQNSRTSLLGDTTTRDGYHMSRDYGCYLTGLMFVKTITGLSVDDITYAPTGVDAQEVAIAIESVNNAYANPFEVTESAYTGEVPEEGYILLQSALYKGAFWSPVTEDGYNELFYDRDMSHKYFATIRFTRETLPVGSIIVLADGWRYRPDGWITDEVQTGEREPMTTAPYVVVTEEWWGDYTIRSFNISCTDGSSVMELTEEEMRAIFRIFVPEEKHIHTRASVVNAPTCTEKGYTTHTCTLCGDSYVDTYVDANGHSYDAWTVTTQPTCTEKGAERRDCSNCDHYETRETAALGHDLTQHKAQTATCTEIGWNAYETCSRCDHSTYTEIAAKGHSYKSVVTAPTCTEKGYTTHTCSACGDSYVDTYVSATGHSYGAWTVTTQPTCTEKGAERRDCNSCDHYETREVAALGHDLIQHKAQAATCTEIGWNAYETCSRCDHSTYAEIAAKGHSYKSVVTAPTCTEKGYTTHTCAACGDSYVDIYVSATGHSYGAWTVTTQPTCTEKGAERRDCSNCDAYETREVAALGHDLTRHQAQAATCTEIGWNAYETCSRCDYSTYAEIAAKGHSYKSVVTAPTCTERGYTTHTCTACGDSYVDTYVDAVGHSYGAWTVTTQPTCTEKGAERRDCSNCDAYETREVTALGHDLIQHKAQAATCTEIGWNAYETCSRCDHSTYAEIAAKGHGYKSVVTAPTCTEQGYTTHTCTACGDSYVDTYVDAVGHSYGAWTVTTQPTCTEKGAERRDCSACDAYETRDVAALGHDLTQHKAQAATCTEIGWNAYETCSRCDHSTYAEIAAKGHSYKSVVTAPTCTEKGYTTHTCSVCGDSYVDTYVSATGHSYGAWTVSTQPTCTGKGAERRDCSKCDAYETREVTALGHDLTQHNAQAATCTEIGWNAYETCSRCDYSTYVEIAAKGHTEVTDRAVEATCTETGLTEGKHCSTCDEILIAQTVVAAKGHAEVTDKAVEATCTAAGLTEGKHCAACGEILKAQEGIPALGHTWDSGVITKAPTQDQEGQRTYTCTVCSQSRTETIPPLSHTHSYTAVITAPTCTEQGYTTHSCTCGDSYVDTYVEATGHTEVVDEARSPSCTDDGVTEGRHCASCGHVFQVQEVLPATGHSFVPRDDEAPVCTVCAAELFLRIRQEYLALRVGQSHQISVEISPADLAEDIQWTVEESEGVLTVTETGLVTANAVGTGYVLASVTAGEITLTVRCRVDAAEAMTLDGVRLGTNKLTTELYSTAYAGVDLLLMLPQNYTALQQGEQQHKYSAAIEAVRFTAPELAELFQVRAQDDRYVQIVPTDSAIADPAAVAGKYVGTLTVTVDGTEYVTDALTLTVKKTLPRLKATVEAFNSFYSGQSKAVRITGATMTAIELNETAKAPLPAWLTLQDGKLVLTEDAPQKILTGKAYLKVWSEEWAVPVAVTATVRNSYKAPSLKLSAAAVQLSTETENSQGISLKLQPTARKDTLTGLCVQDISAPDGFQIADFCLEDGSFRLKAEEGYAPGKLYLEVSFSNTDRTVKLPLTVRSTQVKLKLGTASIRLNAEVGDSAFVAISSTPADYVLTAPAFRLTDQAGNDKTDAGELEIRQESGGIRVSTTEKTQPNANYQLYVRAGDSKEAVLRIQTIGGTPTVTLKQSGTLDLSFPDKAAEVTASFRNYSGAELSGFRYTVTQMQGKTVVREDVSCFTAEAMENGRFRITLTEPDQVDEKSSYLLNLTLILADGTECQGSLKLKIGRTAVRLKLTPGTLTLNKAAEDTAAVSVRCTTKGYAFAQPVWQLMDRSGKTAADGKLDIRWNDGTLTIATNAQTEYGTVYKLVIAAAPGAVPASLLITIPAENRSAVTAALKTKGQLDVIRDGSAVTVTPVYRNCRTDTPKTEERLTVTSGGEDVTDLFDIRRNEDGTFVVAKAKGAVLDPAGKYQLQLTAVIGDVSVTSKTVKLPVKMGIARVKAETSGTLFAKDKNSRVNLRIFAADKQLNQAVRLEIRDARYRDLFEIHSYGNGEFAVGFKDGRVDSSLAGKKVTLTLKVWLDGNETAKHNTTVTVKLTICP